MVTVKAMMPPAKSHSSHQGFFSLAWRKGPNVWMESFPTTEYAAKVNPRSAKKVLVSMGRGTYQPDRIGGAAWFRLRWPKR